MAKFYDMVRHGLEPSELKDAELLTQIVTLSRIWYFLYDRVLEGRATVVPEYMNQHYGHLLCDENLQPLIDEAMKRAVIGGSQECHEFLTAAKRVIGNYGNPAEEATFINSAHAIAKIDHPSDYRRIIRKPEPAQPPAREQIGSPLPEPQYGALAPV